MNINIYKLQSQQNILISVTFIKTPNHCMYNKCLGKTQVYKYAISKTNSPLFGMHVISTMPTYLCV